MDKKLSEDLALVGCVGVGGVTSEEADNMNYVELAKAGGRKDLLYHPENPIRRSPETDPMPPSVDWFAHPVSPRKVNDGDYVSPLKDHWCQWDNQGTKLPKIEGSPTGKNHPVTKKDNVDFTRLLAQDYQREWLQKRRDKEAKRKQFIKDKKQSQIKKLQDHTKGKHHVSAQDQKSMFIMKKFKKVPAKIKLPPLQQ